MLSPVAWTDSPKMNCSRKRNCKLNQFGYIMEKFFPRKFGKRQLIVFNECIQLFVSHYHLRNARGVTRNCEPENRV